MANLYFLISGGLESIKSISPTGGVPTTLIPLTFIVLVSAIKDLIEDCKRKSSDNEENLKSVTVLTATGWQQMRWYELRVGHIIKLVQNEFVPADIVLLNSSEPKGICYIETKSLDGETNLKHRMSAKDMMPFYNDDKSMLNNRFHLTCTPPNPILDSFDGRIVRPDEPSAMPMSVSKENFVLRGCSIRNTQWVYGVVTYTGHQSKIMLNSIQARAKASKLVNFTNNLIILIFIVQVREKEF
jgi:phospholipid-transporting ATPase